MAAFSLAGARTVAICVAMVVAMTVPGTGAVAVKIAMAKPLNFTAIMNGDAWKRKKAEMLVAAEQAKVDKAKKAAQAKADALERARLKKIQKDEVAAKKRSEAAEKKRLAAEGRRLVSLNASHKGPRGINFTKAFENNSLFNGSLVSQISLAVADKASVNITGFVEEKVSKTTNFFDKLFHRNRAPPPPPACKYPLPGEKVFYIIQGARTGDSRDSRLTQDGVKSLEQLRSDPRFARAFGHGKERVQVVIMGPMRKTLETAYKAFHDVLPDAKWEIDMDVRGTRKEGLPDPELGWNLVNELNMSDALKEAYDMKVAAGDHGTVEDRWHRFIDHMRKRDETHFILVTHNYGCAETGIDIPIGGVRIAALVPDPPAEFGYIAYGGNAWRQLSQPSCWPDVDTPGANHSLVNGSVVPTV